MLKQPAPSGAWQKLSLPASALASLLLVMEYISMGVAIAIAWPALIRLTVKLTVICYLVTAESSAAILLVFSGK